MHRVLLKLLAPLVISACFLSDVSAQAAITNYQQLKAKQDWAGALKVMRDEIEQPQVRENAYLFAVRVIAIGALGDYVYFHGFEPTIDIEALKYYKEALSFARNGSTDQPMIATVMGRYYSQTKRNGLALPYFRESLDNWKKANNTYQIIQSYDALASAYNDMGELELRDRYRNLALDVAKGYFREIGSGPATPFQWLQYSEMLKNRMDNIAQPGNAAQLEPLWTLYEKITQHYLSPKAISYKQAALYFASSDDLKRSAELLETARKTWEGERDRFSRENQARMETDFAGAQALLMLKSKQYTAAVEGYKHHIQLRKAAGMSFDDIALWNQSAQAYEGADDLDGAIRNYREGIAAAEKARESFNVAERAAFFRGVPRASYWGLTRVLLKRFDKNADVAAFFEALSASEQIRARQLGELLDPQAQTAVSAASLQSSRSRLPAEEAVLSYVVTDSDVLLMALTRDQQVSAVIPYDQRKLRAKVLQVAKDLGRPHSDAAQINALLTELSRDLLGPVQALLQSKKRLQVLPDGVINALPFDLMSSSGQEYQPLFRSHIVRLTPSLRFIEYAARRATGEKQDSLYALADPAYGKNPQIGGMVTSELREVTRGSHFLSYFEPLPETRTEVQAITKLFEGARVESVVGEQATESAVKRADLQRFRYLHFATHGILGNDVPGIGEPALVLANESGEDGFLTASEVSALKLNAELTVLSACNTGSGEYYTGEGVMGMSRAFLVAGSRAVVVSLWPVASKPTERLMIAFYRQLRSGLDVPDALQRAKIEMIEQAQKSNPAEAHPFFWAPFVLLGG